MEMRPVKLKKQTNKKQQQADQRAGNMKDENGDRQDIKEKMDGPVNTTYKKTYQRKDHICVHAKLHNCFLLFYSVIYLFISCPKSLQTVRGLCQ